MFITVEQVVQNQKAAMELAQGLVGKGYAGIEKMVELNLAASKASMTESFGQLNASLSAKDPQAWLAMQSAAFAPAAEKVVSYGRHAYGIAMETGTAFAAAIEAKTLESQAVMGQVFENLVKNAPAGSEAAVGMMKSAIEQSQKAIDSAKAAAKQAVAITESNVAKATEQALKASAAISKKA